MSSFFPKPPSLDPSLLGSNLRIGIVASYYNEIFVTPMLEATINELQNLVPGVDIVLDRVQGAFEIPVIIKQRIFSEKKNQNPLHAMIALGVILEGETAHAQLVAEAVTQALMDLSLESMMPIIHEVLLLNDPHQGERRCLDPDYNCGVEAARAALTALTSLCS